MLNKFHFVLCSFLCMFGIMTLSCFNIIYRHQNIPYMDEIFHIPQAQHYCANNWTHWDNMITTLPGLYIISYCLIKPVEYLTGLNELCTVYGLRFTNVVSTYLNVILSYKILQKLSYNRNEMNSSKLKLTNFHSAVNIALFPPLYFFTFLYYTDTWGVTFILFMYHNHLHTKSNLLACLYSTMSVLMRQTNIIWVGLLLLDSFWKSIPLRRTRYSINDNMQILLSYMPYSIVRRHKYDTRLKFIARVLNSTYPYITVCCMFVLFVFVNGSIVVGDKTAHSVVFHPMQNLYFLAIVAFFSSPFYLLQIYELLHTRPTYKQTCIVLLMFIVFYVISELNILQHPYLLADNRHYTFYLWKRLFGHVLFRKLVVICYVLSFVLLCKLLLKHDVMYLFGIMFCTVFNLTLQYLFEMRYFIIPYIMLRFHYPSKLHIVIMLETLLYLFINFLTVYLFVNKPFRWEHEPAHLQRFIW